MKPRAARPLRAGRRRAVRTQPEEMEDSVAAHGGVDRGREYGAVLEPSRRDGARAMPALHRRIVGAGR